MPRQKRVTARTGQYLTTVMPTVARKKLEDWLDRRRKQVLGEAAGELAHKLFARWPRESGHAHSAFANAFAEAGSKLGADGAPIQSAVVVGQKEGSGDPKAIAAGRGEITDQPRVETKMTLKIGLPFVRKIEEGSHVAGLIEPISPGGTKINPGSGLYSPRQKGPPAGWLYFQVYGEWKFARKVSRSGRHIVRTALHEVTSR